MSGKSKVADACPRCGSTDLHLVGEDPYEGALVGCKACGKAFSRWEAHVVVGDDPPVPNVYREMSGVVYDSCLKDISAVIYKMCQSAKHVPQTVDEFQALCEAGVDALMSVVMPWQLERMPPEVVEATEKLHARLVEVMKEGADEHGRGANEGCSCVGGDSHGAAACHCGSDPDESEARGAGGPAEAPGRGEAAPGGG